MKFIIFVAILGGSVSCNKNSKAEQNVNTQELNQRIEDLTKNIETLNERINAADNEREAIRTVFGIRQVTSIFDEQEKSLQYLRNRSIDNAIQINIINNKLEELTKSPVK